jgi:hypothetical protein
MSSSGRNDRGPRYILYVSRECKASRGLVEQIESMGGSQDIFAQDVRLLKRYPKWLRGTPILADTKTGAIMEGTTAKSATHRLLHLERAEEQRRTKAAAAAAESPLDSLFAAGKKVTIDSIRDAPSEKISSKDLEAMVAQRSAIGTSSRVH